MNKRLFPSLLVVAVMFGLQPVAALSSEPAAEPVAPSSLVETGESAEIVAAPPDAVETTASDQPVIQVPAPVREVDLAVGSAKVPPATAGERPPARIIRGSDRMIAAPATPAAVAVANAGPPAALNFDRAPVAEVVHAVFGHILGVDYIVHEPLPGTITLATQSPIPPDQILLVIESVLQANGIAVAADSRGLYHVGTPAALRGIVSPPRVVQAGRLPPGAGTVIVPLQFIGAAEMAEILRPVAPAEAFVRVDTLRNLLILVGGRAQIEGWLELVSTFDVDILAGMSVGVFPLRHATVREVQAALQLMSPGASAAAAAPAAQGSGAPASAAGALGAPSQSPQAVQHPLFGALRILPIERINSILVVTPRAAYLDQAREWIERLDRPADGGDDVRLYVYPVQNGNAAHLAAVLGSLFGGGEGAATAQAESPVAPGLRSASAATTAPSAQTSSSGGSALPAAAGAAQASALTQASFASGARVVADPLNNAILIYGSRSEYDKIEAALRRLDLAPTQVLIEASIVEVTLRDELSYGLQWYFRDSTRGGLSGSGSFNPNTSGDIGPSQPGFSYTLTGPLGDVRAVLNALADKSLVRIISSPTLMVLDNHTAAIQVGDQQPVFTTETITDGGVRSQGIEYKDTGVDLSVTPSVNAGDTVTMSILQSVTDVGPIDSATQQRSFQRRQVASRVAVRSGDSVVLGGLIRENTTRGKGGVPILHELPLIGPLFGTTSENTGRTELLVIVTPRVIRSEDDARDVSRELRERMRGLQQIRLPAEEPQRTPQ